MSTCLGLGLGLGFGLVERCRPPIDIFRRRLMPKLQERGDLAPLNTSAVKEQIWDPIRIRSAI